MVVPPLIHRMGSPKTPRPRTLHKGDVPSSQYNRSKEIFHIYVVYKKVGLLSTTYALNNYGYGNKITSLKYQVTCILYDCSPTHFSLVDNISAKFPALKSRSTKLGMVLAGKRIEKISFFCHNKQINKEFKKKNQPNRFLDVPAPFLRIKS